MKKTPKILPTYYQSKGTPIFRDTTALPFAQGGTLDSTISEYNRDRDKNKKNKKPQRVEPFVTSDPKEYAYRKAAYDDSLTIFKLNNEFTAAKRLADDNATGRIRSRHNSPADGLQAWDELDAQRAYWESRKNNPLLQDVVNKPTRPTPYFRTYGQNVLPRFSFDRPVQRVKFVEPTPNKPKSKVNNKTIIKPTPLITKEVIQPTPITEQLIPIPTPIPPGPPLVPPTPPIPPAEYPGIMPQYNIDETSMYATPDPGAEWVNQTERYIDWDANRIPYRLPRFRQPGHGGDLIKPGKRRYIPIPGIETRNSAYIQREGETTEEYGQGGTIHFEPSEYGSDAREHYDDGGPIYTYSKRPGSYYQRTPEGWAISNASTGNQYVPINDPTGERAALLNKYATVYNAPVQGAPKPVMNQAVWNKAQQQGEQDLAAKQFVANVHKQSGTSGLYMPDGSLKPQAAQAANWVPQAIIGAPIAAEVLGAAASIPLGAGVNLGGVANAAGLVHGATQIDNRYQDWQDVAAGNMDWKEAALKTGLTGLDFAGAGIPIKNASNIIKSMNAPTFVNSKTLVDAPAAKKIVGTIDEYGDLTDASGVTVYGASSPIGGNPAKLSKQLFDPEAPAISLKDWKEAQEKAITTNERFIIPKAEEQFLVNKYADEFSKQFNIPTYQLNPKDVGLYGKLKELEFIPTRETVRNAESEYMPALSREIHSDFLQTHKPTLDLTKKEELVLDAYARGYDQLINTREAEKVAPFYQEKIAPILEQSILKNKFQQPQSLIRGTKNFDINNEGFVIRNGETLQDLKFSDLKEGDLFVPKSFTSTSVIKAKPETTLGFEAPLTGFTQRAENLDYVINAPAGQSYMYPNASNIQHFPQEMEVILPKDLQFKLDRVASDVERGYLGNVDDIQKGVLYKGFTKMPNKYFPSISRFDKIVDLKGNKIPKKNIPNMINYHNRMHQPSVPKYYFSIANPYLFGGELNKNC
jgi:hypothetical protein